MAVTQIGGKQTLPQTGFHNGACKMDDNYAIYLEVSGNDCIVKVVDFTTDTISTWGDVTITGATRMTVCALTNRRFLLVFNDRLPGLNTDWYVEARVGEFNTTTQNITFGNVDQKFGGPAPILDKAYTVYNDQNFLVPMTATKAIYFTYVGHQSNVQDNCRLGWYAVLTTNNLNVAVDTPQPIGSEIPGFSDFYLDPVTYPSPRIFAPIGGGRINNSELMLLTYFEDDGQTYTGKRLMRMLNSGANVTISQSVDLGFATNITQAIGTQHAFPMLTESEAVVVVPDGSAAFPAEVQAVNIAGGGLSLTGTRQTIIGAWIPSSFALSDTRFVIGHNQQTAGFNQISFGAVTAGNIVWDGISPFQTTNTTQYVNSCMAMRDDSVLLFVADGVLILRGPELAQGGAPPAAEFRYIGIDSDVDSLYVTLVAGTQQCHVYQQGNYSNPTVTTYGNVTIADVDSRNKGLYPYAFQDGLIYLRGEDGNGALLHVSNDFGDMFTNITPAGWVDYITGLAIGPESDVVIALETGEVWRGNPDLQKIGDAPGTLREFVRERYVGKSILVAQKAPNLADYSPNYGFSFQGVNDTFGTVNQIVQVPRQS